MSDRMRVVGWQVVPVLMRDDGENLEPVTVQPVNIPARNWQAWKDGGDAALLEEARRQVEGQAAGGEPDPPPAGT